MKKVLLLVADGTEETEAVATIDVLRRGKLSVTVASVARSLLVHCANGVKIEADIQLASIPKVEAANASGCCHPV
jgi:4-methyl-5(b-hydroxyethyl)-thiazole monophosphate biosynthesis